MTYITSSSLISFLLSLTILIGCSENKENDFPIEDLEFQSVNHSQLQEIVSKSSKQFVLLSFYSVEWKESMAEIPDLVELQNAEDSPMEVILVSVDGGDPGKDSLAKFLHPLGVNFKTYYSDVKGNEILDSLYPDWGGVYPVNLFYDETSKKSEAPPKMFGMFEPFEIEMLINQSEKHDLIDSKK